MTWKLDGFFFFFHIQTASPVCQDNWNSSPIIQHTDSSAHFKATLKLFRVAFLSELATEHTAKEVGFISQSYINSTNR